MYKVPEKTTDLMQCQSKFQCHFHRNRKNYLQIHMKPQKTLNTKSIHEQKEQCLRYHATLFQNLPQNCS
jgi:hypothetical protein